MRNRLINGQRIIISQLLGELEELLGFMSIIDYKKENIHLYMPDSRVIGVKLSDLEFIGLVINNMLLEKQINNTEIIWELIKSEIFEFVWLGLYLSRISVGESESQFLEILKQENASLESLFQKYFAVSN
ncbi:MAG: hypothetical protein ACK5M7_20480 [Draconibacterium sp.]